jgi:Subtilase family/FlgD Ig-like domain
MKYLFLLLIFLSGLSFGQSLERTYFARNQEITLDLYPKEISVSFNSASDALNDQQILSGVLSGYLSSTKKMYGQTKRQIILNQKIGEAQLVSFLNQIKELPQVAMAAPVYKYGNVRQAINEEFLVRFAEGTTQAQIDALNTQLGGQTIRENAPDTYLLKVDKLTGLNGLTAANLYAESNLIIWAQPNFIYLEGDLYNATANDPLYSSQWAHINTGQSVATDATPATVNGTPDADMDVDLAWDILPGGIVEVIVAIIDSGVDLDHPDLAANVITGEDFSGDNDGPNAPGDQAHGTNVAGLIAAVANNATGVAGIAYKSKIMPIQIFNSSGSASSADIPGAIDYAWQNGAWVLNNSWGGGSPDVALEDAIVRAKTNGRNGKGSVVLFSSGNGSNGNVNYPARLSTVIAVGAASMYDEKKNAGSGDRQAWWGGNYGADLDVIAPTICYTTDIAGSAGYNTASGSAGDYNDVFNGTSAACPNASGVMALLLAADSNLTADQAQTRLQDTADKTELYTYDATGWNKHVGYGRVNAYQAVLAASGDGEVPLIRHTIEQSSSNTAARTISATITDNTGIATGASQPTLYYRRIAGVDTSIWNAVTDTDGPAANVYDFVVPGQSLGMQIQYYISATDNSANSLTTTLPFGGSGATAPTRLFKYWVATLATQTYTNNTGLSWGIFSPGYKLSTISIPDSRTIIDMNVTLDYTATDDDMTISLENPETVPTASGIATNNTGSNYSNTTVDDEATTAFTDGSAPYSGSFLPDNHMLGFDGKNSSGTWTLRTYVSNSFTFGGTLNSWSITVTYTTDDTALPVELTSFTAQSNFGTSVISWSTASELENLGFEISRADEIDGNYEIIASYASNEELKGLGSSPNGKDYSYTDVSVQPGNEYWYKLIDVDYNGQRIENGPVYVEVSTEDGIKKESTLIPANFALKQNFPNPFNPTTRFFVNIPASDMPLNATVTIFDILGKKVKSLYKGNMEPGQYTLSWDGTNEQGIKVPSGLYIYSFSSPEFSSAKRMILMK